MSTILSTILRFLLKPTMVRSAYHLYFRYCRNIARCPSLGMEFNEVDQANKEQFKAHVKRVLEANQDEISVDETAGRPKYLGSDSFTGMSKKLGQEWKEADALTQSVFKDLAKEENDRVKIVSRIKKKTWSSRSIDEHLLTLHAVLHFTECV